MFYILAKPGEEPVYPYTLTDLKRANRDTSFPRDMTNFDVTAWDCYPVQDTTPPEAPGMVAQRIAPQLVDGVWYEQWVLEPAPPEPVPYAVTMRQARLVLLQADLLYQVDTTIAAIQDTTERRQAQVTWEYSTEVLRTDPLVTRLTAVFGLSEDQVDNMFRTAATL
jgi:hypothetical protein